MGDLLLLLLFAATISHIASVHFLNIILQDSFADRMSVSWLLGIASICLLVLSLPAIYLLNTQLIIPYQLHYIDLLFYIMIMLIIVLILKIIMKRLSPLVNKKITPVFPVLLINSVILALVPVLERQNNSIINSILFAFGTGLVFLLMLLVMTCLSERLEHQQIAKPLRGIPILLISVGILSLGLLGLSGW
jgi:H+/Na+-translocating ferredoxin:NAD+ oxidoreductase subunit A